MKTRHQNSRRPSVKTKHAKGTRVTLDAQVLDYRSNRANQYEKRARVQLQETADERLARECFTSIPASIVARAAEYASARRADDRADVQQAALDEELLTAIAENRDGAYLALLLHKVKLAGVEKKRAEKMRADAMVAMHKEADRFRRLCKRNPQAARLVAREELLAAAERRMQA